MYFWQENLTPADTTVQWLQDWKPGNLYPGSVIDGTVIVQNQKEA